MQQIPITKEEYQVLALKLDAVMNTFDREMSGLIPRDEKGFAIMVIQAISQGFEDKKEKEEILKELLK